MMVDRSPKNYYTYRRADISGVPQHSGQKESHLKVYWEQNTKSSVARCSKWSTMSNAIWEVKQDDCQVTIGLAT